MQTQLQPSNQSTRRDAWVEIDLGSLERNIRTIRSWLPRGKDGHPAVGLMGVIKSDAYGHGAAAISEVLAASGATWLAVASVDEGCQLRASGIKLPILVLSPTPSWAIATALDFELDLAITSFAQLAHLAAESKHRPCQTHIHIKADTGMHRLGFQKDSIVDLIKRLKTNPQLKLISVFSHLACADDLATNTKQNAEFQKILQIFADVSYSPQFTHLASSEAARRFPFTHYDMVRVGLNIYGLEPKVVSEDLEPVLALRGRINQLNIINKGESAGYGLTWTSARETKLASIPIGYADGVDRRLSNQMKGLIAGCVVPQVGTISMDQMLFDVSDVHSVQEGDVITLIGSERGLELSKDLKLMDQEKPRLTLAEWAQTLGTITYELACRLRVRLPCIYTRSSGSYS